MNYKKEMERAIVPYVPELCKNTDHSVEEIGEIGKDIPIRVLKSPALFAIYARKKAFSIRDCMILMKWTESMSAFLDDIRVRTDITHSAAAECFEKARVSTIVLHRVNYILHDAMITVYDILERDGRARFSVKKLIGDAEKRWGAYENGRRGEIERSAWYTLQDHLRIVSDAVRPYLERVYEVIRDYMISKNMRDVEVKGRCVVALLLGKVACHSYRAFFKDFEDDCGIDFSGCFQRDDMSGMIKTFASLSMALGLPVTQTDGCWNSDINPEGSHRFRKAWGDFIKALRDDDLMDDGARKAIELNPKTQEEYRHIIEEEETKRINESLKKLKTKYTVKHNLC